MRNPKIYIASKLHHAKEVKEFILSKPFITFTNRWQFFEGEVPDDKCHAVNFWENDLDDVDAADCVVVFGDESDVLKGALVEAGYAIAKGKLVVCVGGSKSFGTWQHSPRVNIHGGDSLSLGIDYAWKLLKNKQQESL